MAKKIILALIILILIGVFALMFIPQNSVDVYIDGENISVSSFSFEDIDFDNLNKDICNYTTFCMNDANGNITTLRNGISEICSDYGMSDCDIDIASSIGENQIPVIVEVDGTSMLPTLQDGQTVLMNKTKDIHIGDIVVAESPEYGGIIKRVGDINGDSIYLVSDNRNVSYEIHDGTLFEVKGITTWVDISNINGVVIDY